jgi:hypothetical protein
VTGVKIDLNRRINLPAVLRVLLLRVELLQISLEHGCDSDGKRPNRD